MGMEMNRREKLNLIVGLSIPSMLAQISTVMMFFIDASMVGHLGAEASASIGMRPALVIGHPTTLVASVILIPVILAIAVFLPGNQFLPLASLAVCSTSSQ